MVGQTILQYQLLEKLGAGGMGEVYKAQDTRLNRIVAIKVLPAGLAADADRRRRFLQEAQSASGLNHPNIITIYDIVSDGDAQYLVMEYVPGKTLGEIVHAGGLPVLLALQYSTQMADALSTAHAAGIIHRDLKPANVMVTPTGLVKILDFGLAKLTDSGPASQFDMQTTAAEPLTREGAIIGTASYMSPEQAEGKRVDARSDIFSFGSVLYEMVTGRRAFDGGSGISTLSAVLRDEVKPIPDLAPDVPLLYEQIIAMCLRKDPNARWQSMKEVEKALDGLKRQLDPGFKPPPPVPVTAAAATVSSVPPPLPAQPVATVRPAGPPPLPSKPAEPPPLAAMPPPVPAAAATTTAATPPPVPGSATPPPVPPSTPASKPPSAGPPAATNPVAVPPPVPSKPAAPLPVGAIAQPPAKSKSSTGVLVLLLVLLLLLGGGAAGAWWWWKQQHKPPETAAQVAPPQTTAPAPAPAPVEPAPPPAAEPAPAPTVENVLTNDAVLQMVQAKVPISQINQQIRTSKTNFTLTPEEISRLRKEGVPAAVIQTMRNPKAVPAQPVPTTTKPSQPVVAGTPPPQPPPVKTTPPTRTTTPETTAAAPRRPVVQTVPVTVPDAMPFRIVLAEDVAANGQEGQALRFSVVDGFKVGDTMVIPPGATVTGSITSEAGKKFLGIGNKMTFRLLQADGVDGQKISVRSKSGKQANGPTTRPFDTGKNTKTKGLAASQGTEYIAYIDGDQTVTVRK